MKKVSTVICVVMMSISLMVFLIARSFPSDQYGGVPGPGFFPIILSVIVFVLGIVLLISQLHEPDTPVRFICKENFLVFFTMLIFVFYLVLMGLVGFSIATPLFLISIFWLFGVRKWWVNIVASLMTTAITYLVFSRILAVILPTGVLF